MSDELEKKLDELENLIKGNNKPSVWSKFNVGTIVTIVVLTVGLVGSWFTLKAEVTDMQEDMIKIESVQERHTTEIQDVKLKGVEDSTDIKHIKEKIEGMDKKLDQLLESR